MNRNLEIQELSIVLAARNHNQALLTLDFLKGSGVIPADWELQRPPVFAAGSAQVMFANGVNIVLNPQAIAFSQPFETNTLEELKIPEITGKYVSTLPNLEYQGVGINPKRFITFGEEGDGAYKYITETILARGPWQNFGIAPMRAGINLVYTLEGRQLRLSISEAQIKLPDQVIPAVAFAGNFHYEVRSESPQQRLEIVKQAIAHWQEDLAAYKNLIDNQFLPGVEKGEVPIFSARAI
ncbi:hypothetical protein [Microseira wollei]|uniref:Uncharacterized protein n=1 Tax=Microseira wollei NIES-4236 TaxID=2530354 RepID=A0AAV3WPA5_9CYAN|nr:hypothetical protein [Microseira wollei]GET43794.1 hypothetical protein MiSe_86200 [Microseira wollei NIES-4236]